MNEVPLRSILADILRGKQAPPLRGGLMFQYKAPTPDFPAHRLFCYRKGSSPPSTTEFVVLRRELEGLLPGQKISLGEVYSYKAFDGVNRTGQVFSWLGEPSQAPLFEDVPTKTAESS